jgi:hypothetical protein
MTRHGQPLVLASFGSLARLRVRAWQILAPRLASAR